ncbi:MAG TPA: hydroxyisourate hydrolase [Methyloceanibacter sp.]|nr:hydroxyisourate hydrolase [Methyloceanibacter sp.]
MNRREVLGAASLAATSVLGSCAASAELAGGILNVHVLDLYSGTPASGVKLDLFMRKGEQMTAMKSVVTDADGRSGSLLAGEAFVAGRYLLAVDLSDYFKAADKTLPANFFRPGFPGYRPDRAAPHPVVIPDRIVDLGPEGAAANRVFAIGTPEAMRLALTASRDVGSRRPRKARGRDGARNRKPCPRQGNGMASGVLRSARRRGN